MGFLDLIRGSKQEPPRLTLEPEGRPFHITIGTVSGEGLHIENSIRMLRSALLYADQVKLCSFTTSRVLSLFAEYGLGPEEYLDWIQEHVLPHILDELERTKRAQTIGYYKELFKRKRQGKRLDREELQELSKIQYERGKRVGREVSKAKGLIGGGAALGFFVDSPESLPQYVRVALGGTLPLGFAIREGIHNWRNERARHKTHMLYFYYRLIDKVER